MLCDVFITLHTYSLLRDFALLLKALNSILWRFKAFVYQSNAVNSKRIEKYVLPSEQLYSE
jgi:hypothetical protein